MTTAQGIGLTRQLRRLPENEQRHRLEKYGCKKVFSYAELDYLLRYVRQGDCVVTVKPHALGPTRRDVEANMAAILAKRVSIFDLSTELHTDKASDAALLAMRAVAGLTGDSRALTPAQARRAGKMSGKVKRASRTSDEVAGKWWRSKRAAEMLIEDAMQHEAMYGWSTATAYRRLGPRGSAAGRKRNT